MNRSSLPAHFVSPGPMFLVPGHPATKANQSRSRSMLDSVECFSSLPRVLLDSALDGKQVIKVNQL